MARALISELLLVGGLLCAVGADGQPWLRLYMLDAEGGAPYIILHPRDPRVVALTWDNVISFDSGQTWAPIGERVGWAREFAFDPVDPGTWYQITWGDDGDPDKRVLRVTGAGEFRAIVGGPKSFGGATPSSVAVHPDERDLVYVGTSQGDVYRSEDGGESWARVLSGGAADPGVSPAGQIWLVSEHVFVNMPRFGGSSFLHSSDAGLSWDRVHVLGYPEVELLGVLPTDPRHLFVTVLNRHVGRGRGHAQVLETQDGGSTWRTLLERYSDVFAVDPADSQRLAVSVGDTILLTENGGHDWLRVAVPQSPLREVRAFSLAFDRNDRLLMSTQTDLLYLNLPLTPSSVETATFGQLKARVGSPR